MTKPKSAMTIQKPTNLAVSDTRRRCPPEIAISKTLAVEHCQSDMLKGWAPPVAAILPSENESPHANPMRSKTIQAQSLFAAVFATLASKNVI
jgi:hypothetical protein